MYSRCSIPGTFNDTYEDEYNEINIICMTGIEYATKRYRKLFMGNLLWLPSLQYARDRINLWTNIIKKIQKARASARYIHHLERRAGVFNTTNVPLNEAKKEFSDAYFRYKFSICNAKPESSIQLIYLLMKQKRNFLMHTLDISWWENPHKKWGKIGLIN